MSTKSLESSSFTNDINVLCTSSCKLSLNFASVNETPDGSLNQSEQLMNMIIKIHVMLETILLAIAVAVIGL